MKALFGRVESRFVVPARSRIGGTLTALDVSEGSQAKAGQVIARISDPKLESQLAAAEARIASARSQLENAETELKRNEELLTKGATTTQRVDQVRTAVEVARNAVAEAEAARQVTATLIDDGDVVVPADGRVLSVPVRLGAVVMPGEPVATITGGGVFLRLAIPERHAAMLEQGAALRITAGGAAAEGRLVKIYPQISNGRVVADVEVEALDTAYVDARVLVEVPVGERQAILVPRAAVTTRSGVDFVSVASGEGAVDRAVVIGGSVQKEDGEHVEILSGLSAGDRLVIR